MVVLLAVAAVGYYRYIAMREVDRGRLAALVVTEPPSGFTNKPADSAQVPASSSSFPTVKAAAKRSANSVGSYAVQWTSPASSSDSASLLVSLLASASQAALVQSEAASQYLGPQSLKSEDYVFVGRVAMPSVSGAQAAVFKSSSSGPPVVTVLYRVGRAQVVEFVGLGGAQSKAASTAATLASAESAHLDGVLPGFSLSKTSWPPLATLVYWSAASTIILVGIAIPIIVRRTRAKRVEAQQRAAKRHLQSRGQKVARRQASRHR